MHGCLLSSAPRQAAVHGEGAEPAGEPGRVAGAGDLNQALLPALLENRPGQS